MLGAVRQTMVISDPAIAAVALDPVRARLLHALAEPGSASTLAPTLGVSRQNVNHHLRALESHGLVELVEQRRRGNMTERVMRAVAGSFVISPQAWALLAPDPRRDPDRVSAQWLLARRLERARELLEATELSVDTVAARCGFGSAAAMRVHMRAVMQTSPSAYRRSFHG